jgi:tol-pal system protein YbgF
MRARAAFFPGQSRLVPLARAGALVAAVAVVSGTSGCARSAEERQLEAMEQDIEQIQRERDDVDPPQVGPEGVPATVPASTVAPPAAQRPPAPSATPQDGAPAGADEATAEDYADPEDTTPRPAIRVVGAPRGRVRGFEDSFDSTGGDSSGRSPAIDPEAKRAYDAALSLVNAKQYAKGLDAFAAFLVKWPDHPYADRAMFWRGDCYFAQGDYARAAEELTGLLARFPASPKAPDALLKLGISDQKLGRLADAKDCFDRLAQSYPQAEAARHIPSINVPASSPSGPAEDTR